MRTKLLGALSALALAAAMIPAATLFAGPATADTFTVTSAADSGPNTLRAALAAAESNPGDDEIDIQAGLGTIALSSTISWGSTGGVTIEGNGATLTGSGLAIGLLSTGGGDLTIEGLAVTGFDGTSDDDAAPILQEGGGLDLTGCTITGNTIVSTDGDAAGAALTEGGASTITNCTMTGNAATASTGDAAGGFLSEGGPTTITTSTINCNTASTPPPDGGDAAGGFLSEGGDILINGTSIQGNTASGEGSIQQQVLIEGGGFDGNGNTISDDTGVCTAPPPVTPTTPLAPVAAPLTAATPLFTG